jgi:protein arginine kinase activator
MDTLCQKCHKNLSTVRYAEVVDGQVVNKHLCQACMAGLQNDATTGFELSGVAPTVQKPSLKRVAQEALRSHRMCPLCGIRLSQVLDSGEVGCNGCYETFGKEIESILEGLHQSLYHKGKHPRVDDPPPPPRADLQSKRALLRTMLRAENYEEAAKLRDTISSLETGLTMSKSGVG